MKLQEVINKIENGDFSAETNAELHKSLRRSGGDFLRSQHCRIMAQRVFWSKYPGARDYAMQLLSEAQSRYAAGAGGTEQCSLWQTEGTLLFESGDYTGAYVSFAKWEEAYKEGQIGLGGVYHDLLRSILLRDRFTMSGELARAYTLSRQDTWFITRNMKLYWLAGEIVIACHKKDEATVTARQAEALHIIGTKHRSSDLEKVYKKNQISDPVSVPAEVIRYIKGPFTFRFSPA